MQIEQIHSFYYEGNALCHLGKFDEAIEYYDRIIEINQDSKTAWGYKAHALSKMKKYKEAFACYQKALEC